MDLKQLPKVQQTWSLRGWVNFNPSLNQWFLAIWIFLRRYTNLSPSYSHLSCEYSFHDHLMGWQNALSNDECRPQIFCASQTSYWVGNLTISPHLKASSLKSRPGKIASPLAVLPSKYTGSSRFCLSRSGFTVKATVDSINPVILTWRCGFLGSMMTTAAEKMQNPTSLCFILLDLPYHPVIWVVIIFTGRYSCQPDPIIISKIGPNVQLHFRSNLDVKLLIL